MQAAITGTAILGIAFRGIWEARLLRAILLGTLLEFSWYFARRGGGALQRALRSVILKGAESRRRRAFRPDRDRG